MLDMTEVCAGMGDTSKARMSAVAVLFALCWPGPRTAALQGSPGGALL